MTTIHTMTTVPVPRDSTGVVVAAGSVVGVLLLSCLGLIYCCWRRRRQSVANGQASGDDERQGLLGRASLTARYLKRSSTYYQWNRPPPISPAPSSSSIEDDHVSWDKRRSALLKKYAKDHDTLSAPTSSPSPASSPPSRHQGQQSDHV